MSRVFPNGSTFKGRFEFVKDVRCFYYAMATAAEAYVELVSYTNGNNWDIDSEVTFKIWVGKEGVPEGVVKRFLTAVWDSCEKIDGLTGKELGLEPHVFCQSVKLLADYDGDRDGDLWVHPR